MTYFNYPPNTLIVTDIEKLFVESNGQLLDVIEAIESAKKSGLPAGLALVVNDKRELLGIITDGDIREALVKGKGLETTTAMETMTRDPVTINKHTPVKRVLIEIAKQVRESKRHRVIDYAILTDDQHRPVGLIDDKHLAASLSLDLSPVAVIGLGYVGITLAVSLAEIGFQVYGFDTNENVKKNLLSGLSDVHEVGLKSVLKSTLNDSTLRIVTEPKETKDAKVYVLCVNTPFVDGEPDYSYLIKATENLCDNLAVGNLVVVRTTVPVGTSRNTVKSIIETKTDFQVGQDVFLAFAPERTIEGQALKELRNLPQIIGGFDEWSTELAARFFSKMSPTVIRMDSLEEAEFVKLINNSFRDISFSFGNEIALACQQFNLDATKTIRAANSGYPRNPISLPSPGVGGLCLTKDPHIFAYSRGNLELQSLAKTGRAINEAMPTAIAKRIIGFLRKSRINLEVSKVFILGFAFKGEPETKDVRSSPTLDIFKVLKKEIKIISGYDPIVERSVVESLGVNWLDLEEGFAGSDAVLIVNNHRMFLDIDIHSLTARMAKPGLLFDGWSLYDKNEIEKNEGISYMNLGYLTPEEGNR
jgi:UDP-N-acetyl-D-mannosaminuronic acid dehydrogenase